MTWTLAYITSSRVESDVDIIARIVLELSPFETRRRSGGIVRTILFAAFSYLFSFFLKRSLPFSLFLSLSLSRQETESRARFFQSVYATKGCLVFPRRRERSREKGQYFSTARRRVTLSETDGSTRDATSKSSNARGEDVTLCRARSRRKGRELVTSPLPVAPLSREVPSRGVYICITRPR